MWREPFSFQRPFRTIDNKHLIKQSHLALKRTVDTELGKYENSDNIVIGQLDPNTSGWVICMSGETVQFPS